MNVPFGTATSLLQDRAPFAVVQSQLMELNRYIYRQLTVAGIFPRQALLQLIALARSCQRIRNQFRFRIPTLSKIALFGDSSIFHFYVNLMLDSRGYFDGA